MRIYSTRFRTINRLKDFINEKINYPHDDIFVQIILPLDKAYKEYEKIATILENITDNSKIYAIKSDGILLNSTLIDDIVINFFIVEKNSAQLIYHKNLYHCKDLQEGYFHIIYALDIDKKRFLYEVDKSVDLVATFYNDKLFWDKKEYKSGGILLKIKKNFELDIKEISYIEALGRELKVETINNSYLQKIEGFLVDELYKHYLSDSLSMDLKKTFYTFPLLKLDKDKVCSSLILDQNQDGIKVEFTANQNDTLKIGYTNGSLFYKRYEDAIKSFDGELSDSFFLISSVAKKSFFKQNGFEYDSAVGYFSQSEAVIKDGKVYDLTHSVLMINIKNKDAKKLLINKRFKPIKPLIDDMQVMDALVNIAKISSLELEDLNKKLEKKVKIEVEKNLKKDSILIHRSRLAQMGEMMSLIAHQWKQPLSAISATSSGLHIKIELDMYDKEFFLKSLTKIEELVNHLSTTIDDFSNFFKPSKIKREFYLYEAVEKALSIATYSLSKKSIDLVLDLDKSLKVKTFQNELIQVLLNLIKNAENILIKREIKDPKIYIKLYKDADKKVIEIKDNAGGIDKKIMPKIFEPYFSTKATKDSTGLGLYMSRFIVEDSLGGELKVANSKDGAVFSILLV